MRFESIATIVFQLRDFQIQCRGAPIRGIEPPICYQALDTLPMSDMCVTSYSYVDHVCLCIDAALAAS